MNNKRLLMMLISIGVILFAVIAFVVMKATATTVAIVPNQTISAGTKIDESMLKTIRIPVNTPKGYITDKTSLINNKLKVAVEEDQLLYLSNIMSSWDDFSTGESIPEDYVVTSIEIPSNRAVGGLITSGDFVDILGVPNSNYRTNSKEILESALGDMKENSYGADDMQLYWVLSNVKILETDSNLSQTNNSSISTVTEDTGGTGAYYIVALSYADYQKLRLSEQYLDLWLNISPEQNNENEPLFDQMGGFVEKLTNAYKENGDGHGSQNEENNQTEENNQNEELNQNEQNFETENLTNDSENNLEQENTDIGDESLEQSFEPETSNP